MLFRNPFRFGKHLPWTPVGKLEPIWSIDKSDDILSLHGILIDTIESAEAYNENYFGNAKIDSVEERGALGHAWHRILTSLQARQLQKPLSVDALTSTAASLSFGVDDKSVPASETMLRRNFLAYLKLILDGETYDEYIPGELDEESSDGDGRIFGKPVWDFAYPASSLFITRSG